MYKFVASLTQYEEPRLVQIRVVGGIHVVHIQIADALIFDTTILAGHIPAGA